jgi:hypothetical protein
LFDDGVTKARDPHPLEAKWGPDGAKCMSNPRALYARDQPEIPQDTSVGLEKITHECPNCTPELWADVARSCQLWDPTRTPIPTCDNYQGNEGKGVILHSFVNPKTVAP